MVSRPQERTHLEDFHNKVLQRIFGPTKNMWIESVVHKGEKRNGYIISGGKNVTNRTLRRPAHRPQDNIEMYLK
jgi:hypothetical protein